MLIPAAAVIGLGVALQRNMIFGGTLTTLNWYYHGKSHFTQTGYDAHAAKYNDKNYHDGVNLSGKKFIVTGANSGLGKEITTYLASKGADVYMVCRSKERAEKAKADIINKTKSDKVHLLLCDVSKRDEVKRMWSEFVTASTPSGQVADAKLNGLVCNAGAIVKELTFTPDEEVEATFGSQVAFGTYLLGKLAMPVLGNTEDSRVVIVSSGGMLTQKLPEWETITCTGDNSAEEYNGVTAYAYAKRAQVVLAEKWAQKYAKETKVVSAHPGWTITEGVDNAFTESEKNYLQPLRDTWSGSEGICWLLGCPVEEIESGAFYLDREPSPKHVAGLFCTEGSYTKNTDDEAQMFIANLDRFTREDDLFRPSQARVKAKLAARKESDKVKPPKDLKVPVPVFMKDWHVLACSPITALSEEKYYNPVESYKWDDKRDFMQVKYSYYSLADPSNKQSVAEQHGFVVDKQVGTEWKLNPKVGLYLPLGLDYLIMAVGPEYSWVLTGVPTRGMFWIMTEKIPSPKGPEPWPGDTPRRDMSSKPGVPAAQQATTMSPQEEEVILKEALLKAESLGIDISHVRIAAWDPALRCGLKGGDL